MKNLVFAAFLAVSLMFGYSTLADAQSNKKLSKTEKCQKQAADVKDSIACRHFTIDVNMAYPQSHSAVNLNTTYSLRLIGDSVVSYLPYYGRAYSVPYGGGNALNFSGKAKNYIVSYPKKDMTRILFNVTNEEDSYKFTLEIFDNGSSTIDVISNNREPISFSGQLDTEN